MKDSNEFRTLAKDKICEIEEEMYNESIQHKDIQVVFQAYVLGQMKATMVVITDKVPNGRYYEVTYSSINNKMFVDTYTKVDSHIFNIEV